MLELRKRQASWLPGKKAGNPMTHSDPSNAPRHRTHPADYDDGHQDQGIIHREVLLLVDDGLDSPGQHCAAQAGNRSRQRETL